MAMKGSKCAVPGCSNYKLQKDKSFYRFPKDKELCKQWVILTQKPGLAEVFKSRGPEYVYRTYTVCSDHFQEKDFRNKIWLSQGLWRGAIPSRLLPKPKQTLPNSGRNGEVATVLSDTNSVQNDSAPNQMARGFSPERESAEIYFAENQYCVQSCTPEPHQPCDSITVKVEQEPECGGNSCDKHRPQEPEYIEVKGEPLEEEEEEATDEGATEQDSLCF
ncbi:uncharacterized protein LOC126213080 [Schistocerca nitens]|uniref:uncharacterized protein LOC126213080 n=1 Tax=Schistocerca nitens TaxID=7011 RepID=UPI0021176DEE|nr:uncharacterized protein LOC126213080 [Schistocerca nitens]